MKAGRVVVVGDVLLDRDIEGRVERLCPDAPAPVVDELGRSSRPGGAGLAATLAAADGARVTLVCALARDAAGEELGAMLSEAGVEVIDLGCDGTTPEKVRILSGGRTLLRLDRGSPARPGPLPESGRRALAEADAVLVSDYGRGVAAHPGLREALAALPFGRPLVWDPHPRGPSPLPRSTLLTPNLSEARGATGGREDPPRLARALLRLWRAEAVAITLGAGGALLADGMGLFAAPAPRVSGGDACGAGDRFASRAAVLLASGSGVREAVEEGVLAASSFVAAGGAASFAAESPPGVAPEVEEIVARVRAAGGKVVATGGCFDLLHAGHVGLLEGARALGDCLVVCLNSDGSVRRLKGEDRPLVPQAERAKVLGALGCVDAVVVFDEDTPEAVLERLRPDIFVKGGDYEARELSEARTLARWGGEVVILPYHEGRSTTRLIEEAARRG
ncbi:D-glycero-beta-D-manno-heptose 1-phosphate adenylyltransferase [Rubrobacter calidifluminis]|uniref:D-glycero-beta-D-manno-heptose 1-phosphate adenylyltransferase n=1 Tax=Rubrobacter calidifluminis TaxID=1392640 RepID=UPI0023604BC3|nr:D-glycero-beta-D-manno-heptose 1-phosphate adenylyltransferase [Rubrobacter calidifluminis]